MNCKEKLLGVLRQVNSGKYFRELGWLNVPPRIWLIDNKKQKKSVLDIKSYRLGERTIHSGIGRSPVRQDFIGRHFCNDLCKV